MATQKQIDLFKKKANDYHSWDKEFIELIDNTKLEDIHTTNMRSLINDLFASYREPAKKAHIIKRLKEHNKKGGE